MTVWVWVVLTLVMAGSPAWAKERKPQSARQSLPVARVRGLDKSGQPADTAERDYAAIDRLEKITVSKEELKAFIKEGGLR